MGVPCANICVYFLLNEYFSSLTNYFSLHMFFKLIQILLDNRFFTWHFSFLTPPIRPAYNRLSLSLLLLDQCLVSSFSLSSLKKRTRTKEGSGSETYPASPAQTCFARDYTEFRMWRGPVFTWPRNPGL